jgi:hypothetical protein
MIHTQDVLHSPPAWACVLEGASDAASLRAVTTHASASLMNLREGLQWTDAVNMRGK